MVTAARTEAWHVAWLQLTAGQHNTHHASYNHAPASLPFPSRGGPDGSGAVRWSTLIAKPDILNSAAYRFEVAPFDGGAFVLGEQAPSHLCWVWSRAALLSCAHKHSACALLAGSTCLAGREHLPC